ncbi:hypothetical protein [Colwellia hornerae]|uniref:Uncharacterized protein n=1 Tax=Colwellia hornerae TaxID=89402 RepID=A0A5C6Q7Y0_9GAMM|nr:hypothetical protein [Colwellia hornerae]TWX50579.1 hypothetical protein ESZ28_15285 [Colwellia hornerae]TWX56135.1 hypothetical protein ESZ26_15250 [Colwellia hornerae]TWX64979.1 hypothetical protein ESZ27_13325 [Colwellia hornerae]
MLKAVSRIFVIAMMLVAFVGQAITFNTSMSCETSVNSLSSNASERVKHYDLNTLDTVSLEDCCGIECCGVNCTCIVNACSSSVYFNTVVNSAKTAVLAEVFYMQQSEQAKFISPLLYRPPIFTS